MEKSTYCDFIKKVIDDCDKWIELQQYSGEYFCEILDNEEKGLTLLQYEEENKSG